MPRDFPPTFLWGGSTSAHQVEGGNTNNDWWDWERSPDTQAVEVSGDAIDQWHRFPEDFALLASLGHTAHRFSIEWSRIQPAPGVISHAAIAHYRQMLETLAADGMSAFVTIYHKALPRWVATRGGWLADDALETFGNYVRIVATELGDLIPFACTINEPQILPLMGYLTGQFPPAMRDLDTARKVNATLMEAHRVAVGELRSGAGAPKIGTCLQLAPLSPLTPADTELTNDLVDLMITSHIDDLRAGGDVGDWVGLQYYTRVSIDRNLPTLLAPGPEGAELTEMRWEVYPEGMGEMLRTVATVGLPVYVTENGIATRDDNQRVRYLASHLAEVKRAMDDGIDIRGYIYWSAFDNYEWNHGFAPTFGLVGIDHNDNLRRFVRPSAHAFERVARTGELAALFAPSPESGGVLHATRR